MSVAERHFCGCCGRPINASSATLTGKWCADCQRHVVRDIFGNPWEQTYFAQHGQPCPYEVTARGPRPQEDA